jgi:hypothetical protein
MRAVFTGLKAMISPIFVSTYTIVIACRENIGAPIPGRPGNFKKSEGDDK